MCLKFAVTVLVSSSTPFFYFPLPHPSSFHHTILMHGPYYAHRPLLPPSPDPSPMSTATLPLPIQLASPWSDWRPTKTEAPPTPPLSSIPQRRVLVHHHHTPTVLPPISHFDRSISRHSPGMCLRIRSREHAHLTIRTKSPRHLRMIGRTSMIPAPTAFLPSSHLTLLARSRSLPRPLTVTLPKIPLPPLPINSTGSEVTHTARRVSSRRRHVR